MYFDVSFTFLTQQWLAQQDTIQRSFKTNEALAPGNDNVGQKCANLPQLWRQPQQKKSKTHKFYFSSELQEILAFILEDLMNSLAQSVGKLWLDKVAGTIVALRSLKGL